MQIILERLVAENKRLHIDGTHSLQCQLEAVQHEVLKLQSESKWRDATLQAIYESRVQPDPAVASAVVAMAEDMRYLTSQLSSLALKVGTTASDQMLLRSLHFNAMKNRETQIVPAHAETLRWLLDPSSCSNLAEWLRNQNGIYWINGKAGSGKSTLMKYLVAHPQTTKLLKTWAGTQTLVTASVYFWHAGTVLQKSQEGLFRSLLFEILRQSPDLIRVVCASKLAAFRSLEQEIEPWTDLELRDAIGSLKGETRMNARFCFFIDGLDEYNGHPDEIIDVLQSLSSLPNIKICVSSRPWNEFIDAFGSDSGPRLALEDLTREDIRTYVKQNLEISPRFVIMKQNDTRSQDLVQEIVDKARGVFLWVVLVTRSLLNGVRNGDRISDLQRRLREFPETLENYFSQMYFSIEETYREQTAQTFKFVLAAAGGQVSQLSLILFSFLDEEDLDAAVVDPCSDPLTESEISSRQDVMRRRLIGRCKGLVEVIEIEDNFSHDGYVQKLLNPVVDLIHRTAHDFLATRDMQIQLSENLKPDFEADTLICKAHVALLKAIDYSRGKHVADYCQRLTKDLAEYAGRLETKSGVSPVALLDETRSVYIKHREYFVHYRGGGECAFFFMIVKYGSHYIMELLNREPYQLSQDTMSRLIFEIIARSRKVEPRDLKLLDSLLEHGGSPSQVWEGIVLVIHRRRLERKRNNETIVGGLKKLLQYGADPQIRVTARREASHIVSGNTSGPEDPSVQTQSAQEIVTDFFGEEKARDLFSTRQIHHQSFGLSPGRQLETKSWLADYLHM